MKIKILGAGSIGNHLSHASRSLGWAVDLCDLDSAALARTRESIYPGRYGAWDEEIRLYGAGEAPQGGYDMIFVGTPPDSHVPLARQAVAEKPRAVLVEKPLSPPDMQDLDRLAEEADRAGVAVFVGYDHVVGEAVATVEALLAQNAIGRIETLDVEFREYWGGIFAAHPWLAGPQDSYLGFWKRGGGASGEHSHAVNLWQHVAHAAGAGAVREVEAMLTYVEDGTLDYDSLCAFTLRTESGLAGRCVQDVVTKPPRKWGRVQGSDGHIEWSIGHKPGQDAVFWQFGEGELQEKTIAKTRPDDFIRELRHIGAALGEDPAASPISLARGIDTMRVVAAAHLSEAEGRRIALGAKPAAH
ncbi:MAG: Gfo/Idh/MocA family oxidoreductase [Rhodovibrionaceae bacterium]